VLSSVITFYCEADWLELRAAGGMFRERGGQENRGMFFEGQQPAEKLKEDALSAHEDFFLSFYSFVP
jgi:hypothetical protein